MGKICAWHVMYGFESCAALCRSRSTRLRASLQESLKHTLDTYWHLFLCTLQPRYCMALNSQTVCKPLQSARSWTIFLPPLLPHALSFIIIKVRFMCRSLGEVTLHSYTVRGPVRRWQYLPEWSNGFHERTREGFTWIREFLMTRLTSSLHSATSGLWSSRFDEKASRWDRKYSAER